MCKSSKENKKIQDVTDNKKFWKTIQPYFSDKGYNQTKITIAEKKFYYNRRKKNRNSNE